MSPRERIFGGGPLAGVVRSEMSAAFLAGVRLESPGEDDEAGTENPTTDDVGRRDVDAPDTDDEPVGLRSDAHDFFGSGGTGVVCVSGSSSLASSSPCAFAGVPADIEVFDDTGEPGTVGVSVVSVTADEGTVEFDCDEGGGESSGVLSTTVISSCTGSGKSRAFAMTLGGGLEPGEKIIAGARLGS